MTPLYLIFISSPAADSLQAFDHFRSFPGFQSLHAEMDATTNYNQVKSTGRYLRYSRLPRDSRDPTHCCSSWSHRSQSSSTNLFRSAGRKYNESINPNVEFEVNVCWMIKRQRPQWCENAVCTHT